VQATGGDLRWVLIAQLLGGSISALGFGFRFEVRVLDQLLNPVSPRDLIPTWIFEIIVSPHIVSLKVIANRSTPGCVEVRTAEEMY
jgi:hypothetical protein